MRCTSSISPATRVQRSVTAMTLAFALAFSFGSAHAVGTASGTSINNLSTLNYSVGGVPQPAIGSSSAGNSSGAGTPTAFVVDNRVNLAVTTTDATFVSVVPGSTLRVTTFSVTNTGNTVQDFALASANEANGTVLFAGTDNFDATACAQFAESGATAGFQAARGHSGVHRRTGGRHVPYRLRRLQHTGGSAEQRQRGGQPDRHGACGWSGWFWVPR